MILFFGRNKRGKVFFFQSWTSCSRAKHISRFLFAKELHFQRNIAAKKGLFMENNTSHLRWNTVVHNVYSRICIFCSMWTMFLFGNETKALQEKQNTMFENHPKMPHFSILAFLNNFVLLKLASGNTVWP